MGYSEILYEVSDRVATVTLNRPETLNALTQRTIGELRHAMLAAEADDGVRAIVLTGAGRGFSSGADMNDLGALAKRKGERPPEDEGDAGSLAGVEALERREGIPEAFLREHSYFPSIPKPVIAAVNGPAAGLGLVLALYCDLRLASERARFTTAFVRRGLIAEYGVGWLLPRLVGLGPALELLFSGRVIGAEEACNIGLVNRVIAHERFAEEVHGTAVEMASLSSPRSMAVMKGQAYAACSQDLTEAYDDAVAEMLRSFPSEDFREGVAHFVEKRQPRFTGR